MTTTTDGQNRLLNPARAYAARGKNNVTECRDTVWCEDKGYIALLFIFYLFNESVLFLHTVCSFVEMVRYVFTIPEVTLPQQRNMPGSTVF